MSFKICFVAVYKRVIPTQSLELHKAQQPQYNTVQLSRADQYALDRSTSSNASQHFKAADNLLKFAAWPWLVRLIIRDFRGLFS